MRSPIPVPSWWTSSFDALSRAMESSRTGAVRTLAQSNGGRAVQMVSYAHPEPQLRGTANFGSAMASTRPETFFKRGFGQRQRPVLLIIAGVHGHEVEGMIGALSLLRIMETGADLMGQPRERLAEKLRRLRLLVIPCANPDGRVRVPYDGLVGLHSDEMHRVGQGTRTDGTMYYWPGCKEVHPMRGDVGFLGGYYDDAGINLMHDEWLNPMSPVTSALGALARDEGPDMMLNLHSHEHPPLILGVNYVPMTVKQEMFELSTRLAEAYHEHGIPHGKPRPGKEDGLPGTGVAPSLNQAGMLYHSGVALPVLFESPHGTVDPRVPHSFGYEQILEIHHILFEAAADHLLGGR